MRGNMLAAAVAMHVAATYRRANAEPAWTPSDLTDLRLWLTAGPTWCFTDAGATTPCGDGDAVYTWVDRSGTGNLAQATTDNRPVLRLDAGGKWYVEGVEAGDDYMQASVAALATPASTLAVAARKVGNTSGGWRGLLLLNAPPVGGAGGAMCGIYASAGTAWMATAASAATDNPATLAITDGADAVVTARFRDSPDAGVTRGNSDIRRNGTQAAAGAYSPLTVGTSSVFTRIGGRLAAESWPGRIYGAVAYVGAKTDVECLLIESYLAGLVPV